MGYQKFAIIVPTTHQSQISSLRIPSISTCDDCWIWSGQYSGAYGAASGYHWLTHLNQTVEYTSWNWIWKLKAPSKMLFFVWTCMHRALPTNAFRHTRNLASSLKCLRCSTGIEDIIRCQRVPILLNFGLAWDLA